MNTNENRPMRPVQQEWVQRLTYMQQSVVFAAIRNSDGTPKKHAGKMLLRWFRRCVLMSAFDGKVLTTVNEPGGGSFTGTLSNDSKNVVELDAAINAFIDSRDEMTLHYFAHAMHAFEILGYKHPDAEIRAGWYDVYSRMAHAMHLWPETESQLDERLGDNEAGWQARNDPSTTCSD